jgi:hypothetical protein
MKSPQKKTPGLSLRMALKTSKAFQDGHVDTRVASTERLFRLARVWTSEVALHYPDRCNVMSPADWCGLARIESKFTQLGLEHSICARERDRGLASFLRFALMLCSFEEKFFADDRPYIDVVAINFALFLGKWLAAEGTLHERSVQRRPQTRSSFPPHRVQTSTKTNVRPSYGL